MVYISLAQPAPSSAAECSGRASATPPLLCIICYEPTASDQIFQSNHCIAPAGQQCCNSCLHRWAQSQLQTGVSPTQLRCPLPYCRRPLQLDKLQLQQPPSTAAASAAAADTAVDRDTPLWPR